MERNKEDWDLVLTPKEKFFFVPWRDIVRYRDLLYMFVKRDTVVTYKQTILGPVWFFIQPILTTIVYFVVFGGIAGISTDNLPKPLFYSSGIVMWNYFSESLTITSRTFIENASLFGKVYFPRLIVPLSKVISGFLKFCVQFLFFISLLIYYKMQGVAISMNANVVFVPMLIAMLAAFGFGLGIIFTSLTTKYRDLVFLIQFGVQLAMYATPIIYPLSTVPASYKVFILANPITHIVEAFRYAFLGTGTWSWAGLGYAGVVTMVITVIGILIFSKVEKTFMDTV